MFIECPPFAKHHSTATHRDFTKDMHISSFTEFIYQGRYTDKQLTVKVVSQMAKFIMENNKAGKVNEECHLVIF